MVRCVLQRVSHAAVTVAGEPVGAIGPGLLVLVGLCAADGEADVAYAVARTLAARLWDDPAGKAWAGSAASLQLPVLLVSQFTLYANTRKPKPDFHRAMKPDAARELWAKLVAAFRAAHPGGDGAVRTGQFQAMMQVSCTNDGPVTVIVDSKNRDDELPEPATPAAAVAPAAAAGVSASVDSPPLA